VKLNIVLLRGVNDIELPHFFEFAVRNIGTILQFIELEPSPTYAAELFAKYHLNLSGLERVLAAHALWVHLRRLQNRRRYRLAVKSSGGVLEGGPKESGMMRNIEVELVRGFSNHSFCRGCRRLRLAWDGKLKPCLFRNNGLVDILTPLRAGESEEKLATLFKAAVRAKVPYREPPPSVGNTH
jgi:cyclic pyranopterin phosphate synthase